MNWLEKILDHKRGEVAAWKRETPLDLLREEAARSVSPPDFREALLSRPIGLIAEVKRRSPSAGIIRDPFEPAAIARAYEAGGAQALSVLMDQEFFGGGPEPFRAVRAAVSLPLLYKEFVIDRWQVWHAATLGASAVLLIVAALEPDELSGLMEDIATAGMQALVEVHDEAETAVAVERGAAILGINNRNLKTFTTDLETTGRLRAVIPADRLVVSESGIRTAEDVVRLRAIGADALLVGEHLLREPDVTKAVRNLMEPAWISS
ncbi:MAG TPA: indole-3-glycerol phosphate synthase TrpC [Kiritimatiellia bacterium]|nr:indole-3-glycerol phosphate synthase TrpC [Kiritimatiellia bacterium]HMO98916.1 indole-3-glycerol phosphate synthase TrpC [Kiritimatiellia bacterium]HMP95751.1 indole-3-glycerol phosphate synthase TrpC [Kiritimatiellia bacterium]